MATRSLIAFQIEDNFMHIYCHWDGYPQHILSELETHFYTEKNAKALIAKGDISVIREGEVDSCFNRGEDWNKIKPCFSDKKELLQSAKSCDAEYIYIFNGKWHVISVGNPLLK